MKEGAVLEDFDGVWVLDGTPVALEKFVERFGAEHTLATWRADVFHQALIGPTP
jgi:hypothetical protein